MFNFLKDKNKTKDNNSLLVKVGSLLIHIAKIDWVKVTEIVRTASGTPKAVLSIY